MSFITLFKGATLVASAAVLAWPAQAATIADCVAGAVPEKSRQEIVRHYKDGGLDGLKAVALDDMAVAVGLECISLGKGTEDQRVGQFSGALAGYTMRLGAQAALGERHQVSDARLQSAWASLTPAQRSTFTMFDQEAPAPMDAVVAFIRAASPDIPDKALDQLLKEDELKPEFTSYEPLVKDLVAYVMGQGAMEAAAR